MIAALLNVFSQLVTWLSGLLPASPFRFSLPAVEGLQTALGWANWLFPFGQAAVLTGLWLAGLLAWRVARWVMARIPSLRIGS